MKHYRLMMQSSCYDNLQERKLMAKGKNRIQARFMKRLKLMLHNRKYNSKIDEEKRMMFE